MLVDKLRKNFERYECYDIMGSMDKVDIYMWNIFDNITLWKYGFNYYNDFFNHKIVQIILSTYNFFKYYYQSNNVYYLNCYI